MSKASAAYGQLQKRMYNYHVTVRAKSKEYRAVVLSSLLYGADTWPTCIYRAQAKKPSAFMMRHLHQIMGILCWKDRVSNVEVLKRS